MDKKNLKNLLMILIPIAIILVAGLGLINAGIITTEKSDLSSDQITVKLRLNYGTGDVDEYTIKTSNATVYSVLMNAAEKNDFEVESTYYEEFDSYLIESINSVEGSADMFWQYYLNGEMGMAGANSQFVQDNDIIEWKYEKFEY